MGSSTEPVNKYRNRLFGYGLCYKGCECIQEAAIPAVHCFDSCLDATKHS
ncbi:unnamed protein product [Caretta caretta]